jgi:hypothetical protein
LFGTHFGAASRVEQNTMIVPSNLGGAPHDFAIGAAYIDAITIRNNAIFGFGNDYGYPNYGKNQVRAARDGHNATDQPTFGWADAATQCTVGILTSVPFTTATFVQPDATRGLDLRIASGSALQRAGSSSVLTNKDIFGTTRPPGAFDIGAFQRSAS